MSSYHVGDVVRVKSDLIPGVKYYLEDSFNTCQWNLAKAALVVDGTVTISEIVRLTFGYIYHIKGDENRWCFIDAFFDGLAEDQLTEVSESELNEILLL